MDIALPHEIQCVRTLPLSDTISSVDFKTTSVTVPTALKWGGGLVALALEPVKSEPASSTLGGDGGEGFQVSLTTHTTYAAEEPAESSDARDGDTAD